MKNTIEFEDPRKYLKCSLSLGPHPVLKMGNMGYTRKGARCFQRLPRLWFHHWQDGTQEQAFCSHLGGEHVWNLSLKTRSPLFWSTTVYNTGAYMFSSLTTRNPCEPLWNPSRTALIELLMHDFIHLQNHMSKSILSLIVFVQVNTSWLDRFVEPISYSGYTYVE